MKVENRVFPNREQMKGFFENTDDNEPIYMLNLLKFKEKAEYKDGRETNLTGREAYTIYAEFMDKHLKEIGGELVLHTDVKRLARSVKLKNYGTLLLLQNGLQEK